jgi:hypothetical protein
MIRNEREMKAAMEWIDYWKSTRTGGQSWIGNEQAAQKIIELRRQIDDYRRRTGAWPGSSAGSAAADGSAPAELKSGPEGDQSPSSTV